ncbi:tRNA epoxyqueuosine(34) reductase QueG [Terrisporobacter sp.]|uniref:tRNA epoxyqueuosine(34) reductase QueG n=1 Tax=Terrisporobacter sp. TaxID=1965305 RepID=UPI0026136680|nr:tRNA epoxyqueuosine(34) reductase QueG [Terrisporobacter sp.]
MDKEKIIKFFKDRGIDTVGVAGVGPYYDLKEVLQDKVNKGLITGMEEPDLEKRTNPKLIMENAESIIVCAFPYYLGNEYESNIYKYCYGRDYHLVVKEILTEICEEIKNQESYFEYKIFTDNGPLVDRYLAYLSGIGYYGINNNIITDKYGSYVFIGYIVNNLSLEYDKPNNKTCMNCNKCVKYCPGNALEGNYKMDPKKCLSYLTQKKEDLSEDEMKKIKDNKMIFGCDICQDVCPHNKNIESTKIEQFKNNIITKLDEEEINSISNKEFKRRYGDRAFSWRGRKIIKRNMDIVFEKSMK